MNDAIGLAKQTRKQLLQSEEAQALEFEKQLMWAATQMLGCMDGMATREDLLNGLPGDELIEKKRKGLKRLKKAGRKAAVEGAAAEDGGADEDGDEAGAPKRWMPSRSWKGVEMGKIQSALGSVPSGESGAGIGGEDAEAPRSATITSLYTPQHRALIQQRNAIYDEFVAQYRQNIQELSDRYTGIVEAQEQWRENWLRSVGMLQAQQEEQ